MTNISTENTNFSFSLSRDAISSEQAVSFWLGKVVIFILAVPGIVGNILAFAVWHLQTTFNATAFLFKYLAVWDTAFLLFVMLYISSQCQTIRGSFQCSVLYHTGNVLQLLSVNVTLLIAISRWIAVVFPLRASRLLTSERIYVSCGVILLYCGALEVAQGIFDKYYPHDIRVFVAKRVVGLALPLLLLLIFNLSLLWTNKRASRQRLNTLQGTGMRDGVQPQRHHMVTAVLLVSLCCFIAYPVGNSLQVYALSNPHHSLLTELVIINVAYIFQVLNSGLNVLIYWFFVFSFRQLAAKLWSRL